MYPAEQSVHPEDPASLAYVPAGQRVHEELSADCIGQRVHEELSADCIGQRVHEELSADCIKTACECKQCK
jgi:hypothetical protein